MAGMIPDRKSVEQIEQDIEKLHDRHTASINGWLKARLEAPAAPGKATPPQSHVTGQPVVMK